MFGRSLKQPEWLRRITYGFSEHNQVVLFENETCAVVKSPGGYWSDNSGRHYGKVSYTLVKRDARDAVGLLDGVELKSGGRLVSVVVKDWVKRLEECK